MKKINITLVMLLALALVFTGCRGEGGEDTTAPPTVSESPTVTTSPETTAEETTSIPETTECKHYSYVTEEITASCADKQAFANSHCIACGYSWSVPVPPPAHNYVDGVCKGCGDTLWSGGLEFRTFADYAVVVGIGTCEDSEVIIPATYNGLPVTEIWDRAFRDVKGMTSVTIPEGVTYIESEAFLNCPDLREIHLPASLENVTGSLSIGFMNCPALETVEVAEGNAKYFSKNNCLIEKATGKLVLGGGKSTIPTDGSVKSIGAHAFAGNLLLKSLNIPEGVTDIHTSAFEGCTTLASVTLPTTLKTVRQSAFKGCTALTSIAIPDSVTEIYNGAFSDCKNLKNVTLSKNLTMIDSEAFKGCAIEKIEIPAGVKELGAAFSECEKLTSVTLPEGFERFVGHTFAGCAALESINLPASLNHLGFFTFKNCAALKELNFGGTVSEWNAVYKQESWNDDAAFVSVNCSDGEVKLYSDAADSGSAGLEYKIDGYGAVLVSIGNCTDKNIVIAPTFGGMAVTRIDSSAFSECNFIESVVIPERVTIISNEAFYLCKNLKKVTLPSTLEYIQDWAFANCESLESIVIPDSVKWICSRAFSDCVKLSSLTLGKNVEQIQENAFMNCTSLKSVTIPDKVIYFGNSAFVGCSSLENVTLKKGVEMIGSSMFKDCPKLTAIKYTGKIADWEKIGTYPDWMKDSSIERVICSDGDADILEITEAQALEKAAEYWRIVYGIKDGDPTPDSPSGTKYKYKMVVTELPSENSPCYKAQLQAVGISTKLLDELNIDAKTGNVILHADASERFYDILCGSEAKFFNANGGYLAGKEVTLDEYCDAVWGKRRIFYTELDLDGDGVTELVIYDSALREATLVLHEENCVMYGFTFTERTFDRLKTDGTFIYEEYPESGNKYEYCAAKLEFSGSECKTEKLFGTYVDSSDVYHYYNGEKSITKDDVNALWDIQNAKGSPYGSPLGRWYLKKDNTP